MFKREAKLDEFFDEFNAMTPEDCYEGELYDSVEQVCYIECDTEQECMEIENAILANLEEIGNDYYEGEAEYFDTGELDILASYDIDGDILNPNTR